MFLVDGYNVIRRVAALQNAERGGGLAAGRRALLATILSSGLLRKDRVVVVFDAAVETGFPPEPSPHPNLTLRYARAPQSADAAIVALLEGAAGKIPDGSVSVVTADRELSSKARLLGAKVVAPERWEGLLPRARPRRKPAVEPASDKPRATASDVDYWLRIFGDGEE